MTTKARVDSQLQNTERVMKQFANRSNIADTLVAEHLATGGKRLRARLAVASAAALGVDDDNAAHWAAAVEILHNATLIHDDIQDGDRIRRGKPTLWHSHGLAQAINAGDLMLMLPFVVIGSIDSALRGDLALLLSQAACAVVRGQALELELLQKNRLDWASYLESVTGKTAALLTLPIEGSLILAGHSHVDAQRVAKAVQPLGVLFQLQDDVLDLYGVKGRDRQGSDLYEGKVSALVVAHLQREPTERNWLLKLLQTPRESTDPKQVRRASERFQESGALADVLDRIKQLFLMVTESLVVRSHPGLAAVVGEAAQLALKPVQHLLTRRPSEGTTSENSQGETTA